MPESTVTKTRQDNSLTGQSKWVTPVIIVLVVALFVISMVLGLSLIHISEPTRPY